MSEIPGHNISASLKVQMHRAELLPLDLGNDVWFHLISHFVLQVEFRLFRCKLRSRPDPVTRRVKSNILTCLQSGGVTSVSHSSPRCFPQRMGHPDGRSKTRSPPLPPGRPAGPTAVRQQGEPYGQGAAFRGTGVGATGHHASPFFTF